MSQQPIRKVRQKKTSEGEGDGGGLEPHSLEARNDLSKRVCTGAGTGPEVSRHGELVKWRIWISLNPLENMTRQ